MSTVSVVCARRLRGPLEVHLPRMRFIAVTMNSFRGQCCLVDASVTSRQTVETIGIPS